MHSSTPLTITRADPLSLGLLLILGTLWGVVPAVAKVATTGGIPPLAFAFWQGCGAIVLLGAICALRRTWPSVALRHWPYYLVAGLVGHAIPQVTMFIAIVHVPVGIMALVITTAPLMTYFLAVVSRSEGFVWARVLGLAFGFSGVLMFLLPKTALPDPSMVNWVLLAFVTPLCFALSNLSLVRLRPEGENPLTSALGMLVVSTAAILPVMVVTGSAYLPGPVLGPADGALLIQTFLAGSAMVTFFALLHRAGAVYLSTVNFLVMAMGVAWGMVLFGERHSLWVVGGLVAVLIGVVINQRAGANTPELDGNERRWQKNSGV